MVSQCVLVHVKCNASGLLSWLVPSTCNPTELQIVQLSTLLHHPFLFGEIQCSAQDVASAVLYCLIQMLICCYAIPELANMSAVPAVLS